MTELYRHIGENTDVPAGDIGVGQRAHRPGSNLEVDNISETGAKPTLRWTVPIRSSGPTIL